MAAPIPDAHQLYQPYWSLNDGFLSKVLTTLAKSRLGTIER